MKKYLSIFFILLILISGAAFAGEGKETEAVAQTPEPPPVANIKISQELGKTQCASQPGKDIVLAWQGVNDKRENPAVASLKNRKEEVDIKLASPVDVVIGDAIKTVLKNCGFDVKERSAKGIETSVDVVDFYAGARKKFFTGETEAKGSLVMHFKGVGSTYDFNLGATKSDKRLKKKNIKQLEEVLTGLLESIVIQVSESPILYTELKKMHY